MERFPVGLILRGRSILQAKHQISSSHFLYYTSKCKVHTKGEIKFKALPSTEWKIQVAVCLTRLPLLEAKKLPIEEEYAKLAAQKELEKSCLSDWEAESNRQNYIIKEVEKGVEGGKDLIDFQETLRDIEDINDLELSEVESTYKEIEIDDNDLTNIQRRPRDSLVLIVKRNLGKDQIWSLPVSAYLLKEAPLKQVAKDALKRYVGDCGAQFLSNSPANFFKQKLPERIRPIAGALGLKNFVFSAFVPRNSNTTCMPTLKLQPDPKRVVEYAWLTRDEIKQYLDRVEAKAVRDIVL